MITGGKSEPQNFLLRRIGEENIPGHHLGYEGTDVYVMWYIR